MTSSRITLAVAVVVIGAAFGLGTYTFTSARGWSYMTDDPRACANCHVMNERSDGSIKSSHRSVAVCNDCHVPRVVPVLDESHQQTRHSFHFTRGVFPEPIRALPGSRAIAEANCRRCHEPVVQTMGTPAHAGSRDISCIRCHGSVGPFIACRDFPFRAAEVNRVQ